jgi:DNA polymerase-3 subunit delta'
LKFSQVIGQSFVKKKLTGMVQDNRLSHALLFLAKEGTGGLAISLALSQYLVCEKVSNPQQGPSLFGDAEPIIIPDDACGVCPACSKAAALVHPDIHFSYPVIPRKPGDKSVSTDYSAEWRKFIGTNLYGNAFDWLQFIGAENKQGNITSAECEDINKKLNLKSFESGYKILIMWMPEYLQNEGNKLLKLIEEPPANTLFLLVAEDESKIIATILSRTQLVTIPKLDNKDIAAALEKNEGVNPVTAMQLAALSDGNYREAKNSLQHGDADWQETIRNWLNAMLKTGPSEQIKWSNEISAIGRERQKQLLRYFNHLLEQSIRLNIVGKEHLNISEKELDFAFRLNKLCTIGQQKAIIEEIDQSAYYIERNANPKMLFTALTIKIYHIIRDNATIVVY